ncbi:MAG: hypothetical protein A3A33_00015 [Candidatus Yanofskybacteria bacterium RIFCSPLOWO2_01_FULL_49_25]|uniref:Uncharacterized protein n=1 Tax=Candidatus Yanofskybacteria bacterium RIFCSPLOWO2_01_FULL_49_25 TaxID=1802701 RepID=A0A1F8GVL7_9BACT|nr:MAG: hypothetical protein A3A33_00015 [Candidatus Yanofskybacteria bacterium RIFCSPLOWO2_01_FULL_49_25]
MKITWEIGEQLTNLLFKNFFSDLSALGKFRNRHLAYPRKMGKTFFRIFHKGSYFFGKPRA